MEVIYNSDNGKKSEVNVIKQRAKNRKQRTENKNKKGCGALRFAPGAQDGIALVMVLILSAISLAIMAALVYMITVETQTSGIQKRYKTAIEAGQGGADVSYALIAARGNLTLPLTNFTITAPSACLTAKLNTATTIANWASCTDYGSATSMTINPADPNTYDMRFELGLGTSYTVYSKIVNTIAGNSGSDEGLIKSGVVNANSGEVSVVSRPYLYTMEVETENASNPSERGKFSILYQY